MSFRGCLAKQTVMHPCLAANPAIKRNELWRHATIGMSLQRNVLGATSRCQKTTYCVAPFITRPEDEKTVEMAARGWGGVGVPAEGKFELFFCAFPCGGDHTRTHDKITHAVLIHRCTHTRLYARRPEMVKTGEGLQCGDHQLDVSFLVLILHERKRRCHLLEQAGVSLHHSAIFTASHESTVVSQLLNQT